MTVKQRIAVAFAAIVLLTVVFFLLWYLQKPEDTPEGVLVYREAYMRIVEQPESGGRLCHSR